MLGYLKTQWDLAFSKHPHLILILFCEIKFYSHALGSEILHDAEEKIKRPSHPKGYSIRPILIHVNGLTSHVSESGLFAKIIDFADFF